MAEVDVDLCGIPPFDCKGSSTALAPRWKKWLKVLWYFIEAKGVKNEVQKKALLLHTAGMEVQELFETLIDPGPAEGEDNALDAYFATKINEPYERHVFKNMAQEEGETVDKFIAKLTGTKKCSTRDLAQNCCCFRNSFKSVLIIST